LLLNQENISSSENSDVLVEAQLGFSVWLRGGGLALGIRISWIETI